MAKKRSTKRPSATSQPVASVPLLRPSVSLVGSPLLEFEDRRTFHPEGVYRPPRSLNRSDTQIVPKQKPKRQPSQTKGTLSFADPRSVLVCIRRGIRKEVLHALGKAGRTGFKRRRTTQTSKISCR